MIWYDMIWYKCEKSAKMVRCRGETWTKARIKFLAQNWLDSSRSEPDICEHFEFWPCLHHHSAILLTSSNHPNLIPSMILKNTRTSKTQRTHLTTPLEGMLFGQRRQEAAHEGISRTVGVHDPGRARWPWPMCSYLWVAEGWWVGYNYGILTSISWEITPTTMIMYIYIYNSLVSGTAPPSMVGCLSLYIKIKNRKTGQTGRMQDIQTIFPQHIDTANHVMEESHPNATNMNHTVWRASPSSKIPL